MTRSRLTRRLLEARHYRLTIVQAGTGYGKTTALAALVDQHAPVIWYRIDAEDRDPHRFLAHLLQGVAAVLPGLSDAPLAALEAWSSHRRAAAWTAVIDTLINECSRLLAPESSCFLVLDDVHLLDQATLPLQMLERLIDLAPHQLHTIVATRRPITFPSLLAWRVKGNLLEIEQEELAFTPAEIDTLFRTRYGHELTLEQAALLVEKVEGWPIALQLVWKNLQKDDAVTMADAVAHLAGSTGDLFAYLAQEVLTRQTPAVQEFLPLTSILRQMTAESCDYVRGADDSEEILNFLLDNGLFVVESGAGHLRYHHLFRELLVRQLTPSETRATHRRAAAYFEQQGANETAIYHWLQAQAFTEAAALLVTMGRELVRGGRLDTLAGWIGRLPADILAHNPQLLTYLGDIARLHSHFDTALGWYQQAERRSRAGNNLPALGQALRGQARLYLDTVDPNQAERLLQEALRLSDGQDDRESRAHLCELLAENQLNLGHADAARQYQAQARELRREGPSHIELPVRILLRTGRLDEARRLLEEQAARERQEPVQRPRAHRETLLLLSLILAYQGEQEAAMQTAVEGTERGRALHSDFVTAVGYMRQGHAWSLLKSEAGYQEAVRCHEEAFNFSDRLDVPRLKVEASWGLCQAYGFRGDVEQAAAVAAQGIELARAAGDEWIESSIGVVMGAAYVLDSQFEAANRWLARAGTSFRACGDPYGEAVVLLWRCLVWHAMADSTRLARDLALLLPSIQSQEHDALFLRPTLLGPPDIRMLIPLLIYARDAGIAAAYAAALLGQLGLQRIELHPGYQLRVQALGSFQLWRGAALVPHQAWPRKKAHQLFGLFLARRKELLHREQICELLWPELDPDDALRDFKIAYSAMCGVLEPNRKPHAPSAFIMRQGARYGLRPEADLWLDTAQFEELLAEADGRFQEDSRTALPFYRQALALYKGDFLQAYPYEDWSRLEQERLLALYLRAAERQAQLLLEQSAWDEAIAIAQAIVARDTGREAAYQLLMTAYMGQGNRTQALQTYERCRDILESEWGVALAPKTVQLYDALRESELVN